MRRGAVAGAQGVGVFQRDDGGVRGPVAGGAAGEVIASPAAHSPESQAGLPEQRYEEHSWL